MYKILNTIGEVFSTEGKKNLADISGRVDYLNPGQEELEKIIADYEILIVGLGLNINKKVIDAGVKLKIIVTATTGLDHIDMEYAKSRGIEVLSLRGEEEFLMTITGTAELAFGLVLDLMRHSHAAFLSVKNYEWDREEFRGHNLRGKVLGIVGLGRLGKLMARYANAFGMKVIAVDPYMDEKIFGEWHARRVDLSTLLEESDVVSIHVHLNKETENMFDADAFLKMKKGAYLVNTARGKIVNESDLLKFLENGHMAGYGTDVLCDETEFNQKFSNYPLIEFAKNNNNVIILPHIGGMTYESREATDIFIAQKLKNFIKL